VSEGRDSLNQTDRPTIGGTIGQARTALAGDGRSGFTLIIQIHRRAAFDELADHLLSQMIPTGDGEIVIIGGRRRSMDHRPLDGLDVRFLDTSDATPARAWNLAASVAKHELLLFLADDFFPGPKWLESHLRLHASRPELIVVGLGPLFLDPNSSPGSFARWLEEKGRLDAPDPDRFGVFHCANTSLKRSFLRAAGGFDEAFPYKVACDSELGLRMRSLGLQAISLNDATAFRARQIRVSHRWRRMREAGESAVVFRLRHPTATAPSTQPEGGWSKGYGRAFAASLRWLVWRRRADRELAWRNFLGAAFASGFERGRARFAANGEPLPALPPPSTQELASLKVFTGGREDCRWVAADQPAGDGLKPVNVFDGYGIEAEENGVRYLSFRNPWGAPQAYFAIDRFHGFTARSVEVEVDILADAEKTNVRVDYDSTDRSVRLAPQVPGAFKATAALVVAAGREWQTLRFAIDDARLYRSLHGADFRIVSTGTPETRLGVRRARVSVCEGSRTTTAFGAPTIEFTAIDDPEVSIIIPTRDRIDLLQLCLHALQANTPKIYEVVVVEDGPKAGTSSSLENVVGVHKVRLPVNLGFAQACNAGAARARGRLLLFLNDDTVPLAGWLEPMIAALEENTRVGVVGSRLLYPRLGLVQHAGVEMDPTGQPFHPYRLEPSEAPEVNEDRILPAVTGACLLIRRELFEKLRGFDAQFTNGYEDVDLCLHAHEAGALTLYCSRSILLHYESASEGRMEGDLSNNRLFLSRWGNRLRRAEMDCESR
jgi:GT2 family glycosyltransferase